MKNNPIAYEWHNYKTGHCYVDYGCKHNEIDGIWIPLDEKNGYTKIPLYTSQFTTQRQVITNADSESALNEYAKKCKEDFTKPSGIAMGWRACYEWMLGKNTEQRQVTDAEIEEASKELKIESKGIELGKEIDDMNLEMLRTGFIIGAKAMRDGKIKKQ